MHGEKKTGDAVICSSGPILPCSARSVLKWLHATDGTLAARVTLIPGASESGVAVPLTSLHDNRVFIRPGF